MEKEKNKNSEFLLEIIRKKMLCSIERCEKGKLYLLSKSISAARLGETLSQPISKVLAFFWKKGQVVEQNQPLPIDLLTEYCRSINVEIKEIKEINFREVIDDYLNKANEDLQLIERSPIISIMGHINHGKTTLLDAIGQTNIQKRETGNITQKINVLQIEFQKKKLTFLDTPGHNSFIRLRQEGIILTDIVVLVIDGKDGIMTQTSEVIDYINHYQLPVIIFINHKSIEINSEASLNRIRSQCQEKGLIPLEWGGKVIIISGNAKEKKSVKFLLENVLLLANLADLRTNYQGITHGTVIDSYLQSRTGFQISKLLIKGGQLQTKDTVFLNGKFSKIKMFLDRNSKKNAAFPGDIVQVSGLDDSAKIGDKFLVINDKKTRDSIEKELRSHFKEKNKSVPYSLISKKENNVNLILIADSRNALETLNDLVKKVNLPNFSFSIIYSTIKLNNSVISLAKITRSIILAFNCRFSKAVIKDLKEAGVRFFNSEIIHEIEDELKNITRPQKKSQIEKICGEAEIIKVINHSKVGKIAGSRLISGVINRNDSIHVFCNSKKIFTGKIESLQINKVASIEVKAGQECGIIFKGFSNFKERDKITAFKLVEKEKS